MQQRHGQRGDHASAVGGIAVLLTSCSIRGFFGSYYQVIVFIDIFQWSNIYTLRKSAQWLLSRNDVIGECAAYVFGVRSSASVGQDPPEWPALLHLYSRLKPGNKMVLEWMYEHEVHKLRIDVRRFISFGMIKVASRSPLRATFS
jgi:hypothetical protein